MEKITLSVQGMSCGHCKSAVEGALQKVGATTAHVNLQAGTVDVTYDEAKVSVVKMKTAIEDVGYDVEA